MLINITKKFGYRTVPLDENAIEVTQEVLDQIGKTKCFDVENNCVIDYDNSKDLRIQEIQNRIFELKKLLQESDYRAIKYAEGEYTEEQYAPYKAQRHAYRVEINELEEELKELQK